MAPHPQYLNRTLLFQDFIHQAMLNIDSPGEGSPQISNQFLTWRGYLVRVFFYDVKKLYYLFFETRPGNFFGIFLSIPGENDLPVHQSSSLPHPSMGVAIPSLMDSRIPGIEVSINVS